MPNKAMLSQVDSGSHVLTFAGMGDIHGQLNRAVELLQVTEEKAGLEAAFVLQVGDLEAHRDNKDLESMYAPHHKKQVGDYPTYWRGKQVFPRPMFFIGGNHESYQALDEASCGGELTTNIHFLGRSGLVLIQGLKVAFLTGIYDEKYYHRAAKERQSVSSDEDLAAQRFLSCFVEAEVDRLYNVGRPDVLLIHEWPAGIVRLEDHEPMEPKHRHLRHGETGIEVLRNLVEALGARLVLCGHMHRSYQGSITNFYGAESSVHCLGKVDHPDDGIAFFSYDGQRLWQRE